MQDIFESPKVLMEEAVECVNHVQCIAVEYFGRNPIREVRYTNPESGLEVIALRLVDPIPPRLRAKASAAINDMRHALDQTLWQSILATNGSAPAKDTYFPFCESIPDLNGRLAALEGLGLHPSISDVIRTHKPYKLRKDAPDANVILRSVGVFAATKHRELVGVNLDSNAVHVVEMAHSETDGFICLGFWDRSKNEIKIGEVSPGGNIQYKLRVPLFVCLNKIPGLDGAPLVPFLTKAFKATTAVIQDIERTTLLAVG